MCIQRPLRKRAVRVNQSQPNLCIERASSYTVCSGPLPSATGLKHGLAEIWLMLRKLAHCGFMTCETWQTKQMREISIRCSLCCKVKRVAYTFPLQIVLCTITNACCLLLILPNISVWVLWPAFLRYKGRIVDVFWAGLPSFWLWNIEGRSLNIHHSWSTMPVFHTKTIESILEPVASQVNLQKILPSIVLCKYVGKARKRLGGFCFTLQNECFDGGVFDLNLEFVLTFVWISLVSAALSLR